MDTAKYIAYYRVSTDKQGQSGLGLEAQKAGLTAFFQSLGNGSPIAEFIEVESGSKNSRIEFQKALELCKKEGATLIAFRLDRLLRSLDILVKLRASRVKFTALDCLNDSDMIINIKAAFAEEELKKVSERTKAALKAKKAQGATLGTPENLTKEAGQKGADAMRKKANDCDENKRALNAISLALKANKDISYRELAKMLNDNGYKTSTGKSFQATTIMRLVKKCRC